MRGDLAESGTRGPISLNDLRGGRITFRTYSTSNGGGKGATAPDGLPHCDYCGDLRLIKPDVDPGHPLFGRWVRCPVCEERVERARRRRVFRKKRRRIARYSHLVGRASEQTFESFDLREDEPGAASVGKAYRAARAFAQCPEKWLLLHGSRGTGKSHLAAAIANHLASQSAADGLPPLVLFLTVPRLLTLLRSGFDRGDYDELLDLVLGVDVLILDDLGVEKASEWAEERIYAIVDHRYQMMAPTVVVTNLRPEMLEERIQDRLLDDDLSTVVKVVAPTYRQRRRNPGRIL